MIETHAESKQHQRIVRDLIRQLLKMGCPPEQISTSGIQNPDLESWARRKGIIFDKTQEVDLMFPGGYKEDK